MTVDFKDTGISLCLFLAVLYFKYDDLEYTPMSYDSKINEYTENSTEMSVLPTIDMNSSMHFTVYTYNFLFDDSKYVTRQFIVLKHSDGILQFTDFHKYIGSPTSTVKKWK